MKRKMQNRIAKFATSIFVISVFPCLILCNRYLDKELSVVALVNGEEITIEEFYQQMTTHRANVIAHYINKYGVKYDDDFWYKDIDGERPVEFLKRLTLEKQVKIKIQQILAKKYGIVKDVSYTGFLKSLNAENKRRKHAIKNKQVVFGPTEYGEEAFYNYVFSKMVIRLKQTLEEKSFDLAENRLKTYYESKKDSLFLASELRKIYKVSIIKDKLKNKSDIQKWEKEVYGLLLKLNKGSMPTDKLMITSTVKFNIEIDDIEFNYNNDFDYRGNEESDKLSEIVKKLSVGEISSVFQLNDKYYMVRLIDKESLGYTDYNNCKELIRSLSIDKQYSELIKMQVNNADIVLKDKIYRQITL